MVNERNAPNNDGMTNVARSYEDMFSDFLEQNESNISFMRNEVGNMTSEVRGVKEDIQAVLIEIRTDMKLEKIVKAQPELSHDVAKGFAAMWAINEYGKGK